MAMRITTRGLFRNYSSNLTKNTNRLNSSMEKVETQRKFNSYAEDPAAASRAFQLRRSYWRTGDQIDNSNYVISKFQTGWTAMDAVIEGNGTNDGGLNGIKEALEGLNDPTGSARKSLGQQMTEMAESVVRLMNVQYGDEYVFAGADGLNVPFQWAKDGTTLLYRNIDVSIPEPQPMSAFGVDKAMLRMEKPLSEEEFNADSTLKGEFSSYADYQKDYEDRNGIEFSAAETNYQKVEKFNKYKADYEEDYEVSYDKAIARFDEATYVDIGIGMKMNEDGEVIPTSAFNSALNGLEFLGNGVDKDGDSKNLAVLLRELGSIFGNCDPDSGEFASAADKDRAAVLTGKLQDAMTRMIEQHSTLSADVNYLNTNVSQLSTNKDLLNEQIMDIEEIDAADAITNMLWAQYSYNAALRIGTNILSQSLIDYMS